MEKFFRVAASFLAIFSVRSCVRVRNWTIIIVITLVGVVRLASEYSCFESFRYFTRKKTWEFADSGCEFLIYTFPGLEMFAVILIFILVLLVLGYGRRCRRRGMRNGIGKGLAVRVSDLQGDT